MNLFVWSLALTSGWPRMTLCDLWIKWYFWPNLVTIKHFLANWSLVDPGSPLHDLWTQQLLCSGQRFFPPIFPLSQKHQENDWEKPCTAGLHSTEGNFFLPTKFDIHLQHFKVNWHLVDLVNKFGSYRPGLSQLTFSWPQLTPAWPLTPSVHYTLLSGFEQIW